VLVSWKRAVAKVIEQYLARWSLSSPTLLAQTKSSWVYKVRFQKAPAVLKVLTEAGIKFESASSQILKCYDGRGAVKLLESTEGALLLEHIDGSKLSDLVRYGQDREAAHIICDVLDQLHLEASTPDGVHDLERHFQSLFVRAKNENTDSIFQKTAKVAQELIKTESSKKLLHGDIHHSNILRSSTRGWLAIDPQGLYGEGTYDVANSFFNPDDLPEIVEMTERIRGLAQIFSDRLKLDPRRVLQFAYAHGGLSSSWQLDDGENPARRLLITGVIGSLL